MFSFIIIESLNDIQSLLKNNDFFVVTGEINVFLTQFSLNYSIFKHWFRPAFDDEDAMGQSRVETIFRIRSAWPHCILVVKKI